MDPAQLLEIVKDNVVVQWFLVIVVILTVGTQTATKLKGPFGALARWFQAIGDRRTEREASERREKRLRLIQESSEGREFVLTEIEQLQEQIRYLYGNQSKLETLIRTHLGWDYERVRQLIALGVQPGEIPNPPPLRVELRDPDTVPQAKVPARRHRRAEPDADGKTQVNRAPQ